jgi:NAD(P)-dependent dehydrogenase (short-subunit alcohol dehydrogenase family)
MTELAGFGITVNDIAPGMILTPMSQAAMDDAEVRRDAERTSPYGALSGVRGGKLLHRLHVLR